MKLDDIIGQKNVIETIKIVIKSRKKQNKVMANCLISGPPGTGKTSIAKGIANEWDEAKFKIIDATHISGNKIDELAIQFLDWQNESSYRIFFIDEIHALNKRVQETIYSTMSEGVIGIDRYELGKFTVLAATTTTVEIPLMQRFEHHFEIQPYKLTEIEQIIKRLCTNIDAKFLAPYCRHTPRIAKNYLSWLQDYNIAHENASIINANLIKKAMSQKGVLEKGLTSNDIEYIKFLYSQNSRSKLVGIDNIVAGTGLNKNLILEIIEPYLIKMGFVTRGQRGRCLNLNKAKEWKELIK